MKLFFYETFNSPAGLFSLSGLRSGGLSSSCQKSSKLAGPGKHIQGEWQLCVCRESARGAGGFPASQNSEGGVAPVNRDKELAFGVAGIGLLKGSPLCPLSFRSCSVGVQPRPEHADMPVKTKSQVAWADGATPQVILPKP